MKNILEKIFVVLAILGLIISSYLTYAHYNIDIETTQNFCSVGGALDFLEKGEKQNSCAAVLESDYSKMFGIPTSIFGIVFYIFVLILFFIKDKSKVLRNILSVVLVIGFLESAYFTYLQFFVIDGFCIYCFSSAVITLILLSLEIIFRIKKKK